MRESIGVIDLIAILRTIGVLEFGSLECIIIKAPALSKRWDTTEPNFHTRYIPNTRLHLPRRVLFTLIVSHDPTRGVFTAFTLRCDDSETHLFYARTSCRSPLVGFLPADIFFGDTLQSIFLHVIFPVRGGLAFLKILSNAIV